MKAEPGKILAITLNTAIDKVYAVDNFTVGGVFRPREMTATAGGKGLNVARVAHLLEAAIIATGFLGGGNGSFIEKQVRETGIEAAFVHIAGESRICINITDQKNSISTEVLEPGPVISPQEQEDFLRHYRQLLTQCKVVTASGSLPQGVPSDFYRTLIEIAVAQKVPFILDSSGEALEQGVKANPYMIKPNQEEVQRLARLDNESDPLPLAELAGALQRLQRGGIVMPCISLGKEGCLAALPDGIYHFYGPPLQVVNPVGSGDAFVAGCAVGLTRGMNSPDVIKLGMASGMANTQFFKTGMVSLELVAQYLQEIQFTALG